MVYVLGLKPNLGNTGSFRFWGTHDAGACLLKDGEPVAIAEEERFTREKQAPNTFPVESTRFVLDHEENILSDVDAVGIGYDPLKRFENVKRNPSRYSPVTAGGLSLGNLFGLLEETKTHLAARKGYHYDVVANWLGKTDRGTFDGVYNTVTHHLCHAASAVYCADADRPICLTIDGEGESDSTVLWDPNLERVCEFSIDNSLGRFYARSSGYLGFRGGRDAGKVMGLASYGSYREEYARAMDELVDVSDGGYDVTAITDADAPVDVLESYFGERRVYPEEFTDAHKHFAYHLQLKTEEIVTHLVEEHVAETDVNDVALAGGVAMNCKLNREVRSLDCVDSLCVPPVANDLGICLGAALEAHRRLTGRTPDVDFTHIYYGPEYDNSDVEALLENSKPQYERVDDIADRTAQLLADGELVGWFQGRLEYDARALGRRSILANPTEQDALELVNKNVKNREAWRPFAPSLLYEAREEYLVHGDEAPYMILLDEVPDEKKDEVPAIIHVDGTTRPQTVRREVVERYYDLISRFADRTGVPVVLNKSFNVSGEPIVESPAQAIKDFYTTGLDTLAI